MKVSQRLINDSDGKSCFKEFYKKKFKVGREEIDSMKYGYMMEWEFRVNKISKFLSIIFGGYIFMIIFLDNFQRN